MANAAIVAVVICNWNKRDDLIRCIESVILSTYALIDIYVVDNASTDGSAEAVTDQFGDRVQLIRIEENLGGAGGFNAGMRKALTGTYEYLYLLDNDVVIDKSAIALSRTYMDEQLDIGILGSIVYSLDNPSQVQELGASIDWNDFTIRPNFKGYLDRDGLPNSIECDYVPACALMVRTSALEDVGLMDEQYFLYWDDIDWGYRMKKAGYRVVSFAGSKVWHKMGVGQNKNTSGTYYFWRNRIHFFCKYLEAARLERFFEQVFKEAYQACYFSLYGGKANSAKTIITAIQDAAGGVRGRAGADRIRQREDVHLCLRERLAGIGQGRVNVVVNHLESARAVVNHLRSFLSDDQITLLAPLEALNEFAVQFPQQEVLSDNGDCPTGSNQTTVKVCLHVADVRADLEDDVDIYVDRFLNVIHSPEERRLLRNYDAAYDTAYQLLFPRMRERLHQLNAGLHQST